MIKYLFLLLTFMLSSEGFAQYATPEANQLQEKISTLIEKEKDPVTKAELESIKNLVEKLTPRLSEEATKARGMTEKLLASATNTQSPVASVLKDQVNPLLAYLQAEDLRDEAFYMYDQLNKLLAQNGSNAAVTERIVSILSRIGESSRPLIKEVLETYGMRVMREAMTVFYKDPENDLNARTFMGTLKNSPEMLSDNPGLAVFLASPKDILEKGGKVALDQIPSLTNGMSAGTVITMLWHFAHPSLKAAIWMDFFKVLSERRRALESNPKATTDVDFQKLSSLERVLNDLIPDTHKGSFKTGMDKLRAEMAQKAPTMREGQKEFEALLTVYGPDTPFDVNKYGPNPAMLLFRMSPEDMGTTLKRLLGDQMRINRTAFYSLLAFTDKDQRKAFRYLFTTVQGIGGSQRTELLNNLPTTSKQRTKSSKNDVKKFTQTLTEVEVDIRDAVNNFTPTLAPPVATSTSTGAPPPPPPPPPPGGIGAPPPPPPGPPPPPELDGTSTAVSSAAKLSPPTGGKADLLAAIRARGQTPATSTDTSVIGTAAVGDKPSVSASATVSPTTNTVGASTSDEARFKIDPPPVFEYDRQSIPQQWEESATPVIK